MPRGRLKCSELAQERNLQSVTKSSLIFQENFILLTGRNKTKLQSCTSLLLITKFIYLIKSNLILITPDNIQNFFLKVPFTFTDFLSLSGY